MPLQGPPAFFLQATPLLTTSAFVMRNPVSCSKSLQLIQCLTQSTLPKRPGLPGLLKSSAKSSGVWLAPLLVAWLSHLAKPGCPKRCLTSVFSLMASGARHIEIIVFFFFFLHKTLEHGAPILDELLLQWQSGKLLFRKAP